MTIAYRLMAIGDDEVEREVAIIGSLTVPPNSLLVISVPRNTFDADFRHLRSEWHEFTDKYSAWRDIPTVIIRAGDIRFACLTRVEVPE